MTASARRVIDQERFGSVDLVATEAEDAHRLLDGMGPEPLDDAFSVEALNAALGWHTVKPPSWINGWSPDWATSTFARLCFDRGFRRSGWPHKCQRAQPGCAAIKATLTEAIAAGGSSLRDYVQPDGELGYFQKAWKVYGREGARCEECPGETACTGVRRIVQSGRSTFYCGKLQR